MKRVLRLTLKKKWFDMIEAGIKKEEYREIKPYWIKRLNPVKREIRQFDIIEFVNGYRNDSRRFSVNLCGITIGQAKQKWVGDDYQGEDVYILHLGEKISGNSAPRAGI